MAGGRGRRRLAIALAAGVGLGVSLGAGWRLVDRLGPKRSGERIEQVATDLTPAATHSVSASAEAPSDLVDEAKALEVLRRLARPTVDLVAWSNDPEAREDDCVLMLPIPRPDDHVQLRPGTACELVSVNGKPIVGTAARDPIAFPPFRAGVNWVRVRTTLPRTVLGFAEVPEDRALGELPCDSTAAERDAYEMLRNVLYPPGATPGENRPEAVKTLLALPPGEAGLIRAYGQAWIDLACGLRDLGHGTEMTAFAAMEGSKMFLRQDVRAASRRYLDAVGNLLVAHPQRDAFWAGLGWQLRWGDAWDASRTAFAQALALEPRNGWTWFELARWEHEMLSFQHPKDPRTREAVGDQCLVHFRLALKHLQSRELLGVAQIVSHIRSNIVALERRKKH